MSGVTRTCRRNSLLESEPADDFVKDEQSTVLVAKSPQSLQEFRTLNQQAVVGWQWLDDHSRNVVAVFVEGILNGFEVVQRADERGCDRVLRDAGAAGDPERR